MALKYQLTLNNLGVRNANPLCSQKYLNWPSQYLLPLYACFLQISGSAKDSVSNGLCSSVVFFFCDLFFSIYFYFLEANYFTILWWFMPYIDMNQPWIYMNSPSRSPLPPPSPPDPSGSFESVLMRWMKLERIIQSEVIQKDKDQYSILTHIYGI